MSGLFKYTGKNKTSNQQVMKRMEVQDTQADLLFKTIRSRGFMNRQTRDQLFQRAVILDYDTLCLKIEQMMAQFVISNCQQTFVTFIINTLLQTQHELNLVEQELISIWASIQEYKDRDTVVSMYNDFLNDVLKGQTHLHFYI